VGSNPTGAIAARSQRRSSMAEHRNVSDHNFVGRLNNTRSTAGAEYMAKQVRLPPGPLGTIHLRGRPF
jgi:hypothetical protein